MVHPGPLRRGDPLKSAPQYGLKIGKRAFTNAFVILFALMIVSGVLTRLIPAGSYERQLVDARETVIPGSYSPGERPSYPVWRWFTAPAEVLWGEVSLMIVTIILLIVLIAGAFAAASTISWP